MNDKPVLIPTEQFYAAILSAFKESAEKINELEGQMNYTKLATEAILHSQLKAKTFMIGSYTQGQGVSFSNAPMVQYTEMQARAECRRLAELNKNKTYFYVQLKGGEKVVTNPQIISV